VREEGASVLLSGLVPRVVWISAFGAVYLGLYELAKETLLGLRTNSWSKPLGE
jgi:solute carrier family 25 S-adenosylmethionine transporter 26